MVSSKSPCRLERWGQLLFSSHRRWQTSSESWVLKWFASAAPTSSSVMPRAAAGLSRRIEGATLHRRSCVRSPKTSACRWRSSSATAECLLGIKTGVAVCRKLSRVLQGQGQQVIHHNPCRQDRGLGPFNRSGGIWAIRHQASAHPPHPSAIPRAASRIGPCALRWGGCALASSWLPALPHHAASSRFCSAGPSPQPFSTQGPRGPGSLRFPLPSRRAPNSLSAALHHRCPAASPASGPKYRLGSLI